MSGRSLAVAAVLFGAISIAATDARADDPQMVQALDESRTPPKDNEARGSIRVELDHAFQSMYGLGFDTTSGRIALGAQGSVGSGYVVIDGGGGEGPNGLKTWSSSLGLEGLARLLSFWRLGGGARLGYFQINRVTGGQAMKAFSIGAFASTELDLYSFGPRDDHALYGGARFDVDMFQGNDAGNAIMIGPRLFLGFRY